MIINLFLINKFPFFSQKSNAVGFILLDYRYFVG